MKVQNVLNHRGREALELQGDKLIHVYLRDTPCGCAAVVQNKLAKV